jgi:thioredoxin-like negative regulator of GroEL
MLGPIIEEVAAHYDKQAKVKVIKIDVDANQDLAAAFQVQSIPTVYLMHKGQAVDRMIGVQQGNAYIEKIDGLLEA